MKTAINLVYEAFKNSGKGGFKDWMIENEELLKNLEKEQHFQSYREGNAFLKSDSLDFKSKFEQYYNETYGGNK
jgi:hypothetical protein